MGGERLAVPPGAELAWPGIAVYRKIIDAGDVEQFALRLACHSDEISAITAIIREDQLTSRRDTIDFISHVVDSGVVERWEVSDQGTGSARMAQGSKSASGHEQRPHDRPGWPVRASVPARQDKTG
jgi:hypothetical protein